MKTHTVLITALIITSTAAARAQSDQPFTESRTTWSEKDWMMAPLAGAATGVVGGLGGALAGSVLDGSCVKTASNDCFPVWTIAGMGSGLIIGSAVGVNFYGKRRGLGGSFRSAVIGSLIGNVASGSFIALAGRGIENKTIAVPLVLTALVAGPALGATIGYKWSRPDDDEPSSGALLDVTPARVKLAAPAIAIVPGKTGISVYVPVAGGSF